MLRFLDLEAYLAFHNSLLFIFSILKFCVSSVDFFQFFFQNFQKKFLFVLKKIRCSKYKQGIVKILMNYQMQNLECSIFKIATRGAFLINKKISFSKRT